MYIALTEQQRLDPGRSQFVISELTKQSYASAAVPGSGYYLVPDLTQSYRHVLKRNGSIFSKPLLLPGYYDVVNENLERRRIDEGVSLATRREATAYVVFTPKYKEYGHFLIETLPKMLVARHLIDQGYDQPVVVPSNPPTWVEEFISVVLADCRLIRVNEFCEEVLVETAIVPALLGGDGGYEPLFSTLTECKVVNKVLRKDAEKRRDIFISRSSFLETKKQPDFQGVE